MPFPFALPTTSHLSFQSHLTSSTHPSLPSTATAHRAVLRSALKSHKRLPAAAQPTNLPAILSALQSYIPYLLALDAALSSRSPTVAGEDIDVTLIQEITVEWRPTLSSSSLSSTVVPGGRRDRAASARVKGCGLDYEIHSVLHTYATVFALLARQALLGLYASAATFPDPAQRLATIQSATKHLTTANGIHLYLLQRTQRQSAADDDPSPSSFPADAVDVAEPVQAALAGLSHAEATLLFVLKDDPYPGLLVQSRNRNDREWMIKAPEIPRVRVGLLARLCLGAAEEVGREAVARLQFSEGGSGKGKVKVDADLTRYCEDLRRVARAKACRFLGIEREMEGRTGEGIAWLRGGMSELGMEISKDSGHSGLGFGRLKSEWKERREDRRLLDQGSGKAGKDWGLDAGKAEEGRVLEWLERKWSKMNDTVNVQVVPDWRPLVAAMPSGRDALTAKAWVPLSLEEEEVSRMRAPPELTREDDIAGRDSSEDEDEDAAAAAGLSSRAGAGLVTLGGSKDPVGAFPGTRKAYTGGGGGEHGDGNDYY